MKHIFRKDLPRCPVCGRIVTELSGGDDCRPLIHCIQSAVGATTHSIWVKGNTVRDADKRWIKLCGRSGQMKRY